MILESATSARVLLFAKRNSESFALQLGMFPGTRRSFIDALRAPSGGEGRRPGRVEAGATGKSAFRGEPERPAAGLAKVTEQ
jgi:hypothetical protein